MHKEGRSIVAIFFVLLTVINLVIDYFISSNSIVNYSLGIASVLFLIFIIRFFRKPKRPLITDENTIYAPADGTVMVIEETTENEFFKDKRIQVSIFMSVWNIHINWYPISGIIKYFKYHPGRFLIAKLPKSSIENERTSVVIEDKNKRQILVRQIAGIVAKRIVCYAKVENEVSQNSELGFIRFGSRVDVYLPVDAKIHVELGQKTKGTLTKIASF